MRRREVIYATLGLILIFLGLRMTSPRYPAPQDASIEAGGCRVPISRFESSDAQTGAAVLLHGLSANRRTMFSLAQTLSRLHLTTYSLDLPGHGDNTESFSFERAEECARAAVEELARRGDIDLRRTMLVGHSMGGGIAIRMADKFETAATVGISPAPLVPFDSAFRRVLPYDVPKTPPGNLLTLSAEFEPRDLKRATQSLVPELGLESTSAEAFRERKALAWREIPATTHVSLILDRRATWEFVQWAERSYLLKQPDGFLIASRFLRHLAIPLGVLLVFPLAASIPCLALGHEKASEVSEGRGRISIAPMRILAAWSAASLLAVLALWLWVPLRFMRMYTGDYLASFFLLTGTLLAAWVLITRKSEEGFLASLGMTDIPNTTAMRGIAAGTVVGFVTFLAVAWWLDTRWYDAWMNAERWWRFAVLAPLLLPYLWAEELALDKLGEEKQVRRYNSLRRWGLFLLLRTIAWAAMAGALWVLDGGQILIVLMVMFFLLFSVLQRAGANGLARRAGRAAAAAFSAILAAWFIAAVFPLL